MMTTVQYCSVFAVTGGNIGPIVRGADAPQQEL